MILSGLLFSDTHALQKHFNARANKTSFEQLDKTVSVQNAMARAENALHAETGGAAELVGRLPERILIVSDAWLPQINGVVRTYQNILQQFEGTGCDVRVIGPADFPNTAMPSYPEIRLALPMMGRLRGMIDLQRYGLRRPVLPLLPW